MWLECAAKPEGCDAIDYAANAERWPARDLSAAVFNSTRAIVRKAPYVLKSPRRMSLFEGSQVVESA